MFDFTEVSTPEMRLMREGMKNKMEEIASFCESFLKIVQGDNVRFENLYSSTRAVSTIRAFFLNRFCGYRFIEGGLAQVA